MDHPRRARRSFDDIGAMTVSILWTLMMDTHTYTYACCFLYFQCSVWIAISRSVSNDRGSKLLNRVRWRARYPSSPPVPYPCVLPPRYFRDEGITGSEANRRGSVIKAIMGDPSIHKASPPLQLAREVGGSDLLIVPTSVLCASLLSVLEDVDGHEGMEERRGNC